MATIDSNRPKRREAHLIVGGVSHDLDFVRLECLHLLANYPHVRTRVSSTWEEFEGRHGELLIAYTCNVAPSSAALATLESFLSNGGRMVALHATNSLLTWGSDGVSSKSLNDPFLSLLGSAFQAHPPMGSFTVEPVATHPLVEGVGAFEVHDELYLSDSQKDLEVLLAIRFGGEAPGFVRRDWPEAEYPILYLRRVGKGCLLYLNLGHARGHYDAPHRTPYLENIERGAWDSPVFRELLDRAIDWGMEAEAA